MCHTVKMPRKSLILPLKSRNVKLDFSETIAAIKGELAEDGDMTDDAEEEEEFKNDAEETHSNSLQKKETGQRTLRSTTRRLRSTRKSSEQRIERSRQITLDSESVTVSKRYDDSSSSDLVCLHSDFL